MCILSFYSGINSTVISNYYTDTMLCAKYFVCSRAYMTVVFKVFTFIETYI